MAASAPHWAPVLSLQPDWEGAEDLWARCAARAPAEPGQDPPPAHAARVPAAGGEAGEFSWTRDGPSAGTLSHAGEGVSCRVRLPARADALPFAPHTAQLAPDGRCLVAGEDGGLRVLSADAAPVELRGHVLDVYAARFFPSFEVVLSGGIDRSVRIWSAADGSNPVTLRGHAGAVLAVGFVERGRNVLSAGADGTVRLWDCGSASELHCWDGLGPVSSLAVLPGGSGAGEPVEHECGTEGKVLVAAGEGAGPVLIDARARGTVGALGDVAADCLSAQGDLVAAGCVDGAARVWDLRAADAGPVREVLAGPAPVTGVAWAGADLWVAARDGLLARFDEAGAQQEALLGFDCAPVLGLTVCEAAVAAVGRDQGLVRW